MTEERFLEINPDAKALASRKLHPGLHDSCVMKVYFYYIHGNQCAYAFCYQGTMVFNPILMDIPIVRDELSLFVYEWFIEWETITDIKAVMEDEETWGYSNPSHRNDWAFATPWIHRYNKTFYFDKGYHVGENLREKIKDDVLSNTEEYLKNATREEIKTIKESLEAMLRVL